ncbi:hypothetical protein BVRB_8g183140 [Beta vulgaris subsp. vulgaris]|nr:hypothetical protein BVRB_8g183140 [Beta vulgaris subsp. vulgaris]
MKLWLVVEKGKAEDYKKREKKRRKIIVFVSELSLGRMEILIWLLWLFYFKQVGVFSAQASVN